MRFNYLLSFLPVTFSFAFLPALLLSVLLPHCFPTIICPVEIIYLSLLLPAFFASTTVKLQLSPPSLLLSILSSFLPLYITTSLTFLLLSCIPLPALLFVPVCPWLICSLHALSALCLLKAGAQDPVEELRFLQDLVPKS